MATILSKNLHLCFTKSKRPSPLSPIDHIPPLTTSILVKNFNSLYDFTFDSNSNSNSNSNSKSLSHSSSSFLSTSSNYSDADADDAETKPTPDFASIASSQRLFFSSPGRSNSIIESTTPPSESTSFLSNSMAIPTYSPDPYLDFRRSMQEMVESCDLIDVKSNWEYLHELLLCYLALNPKSTHKFIINAFADLLVSMLSPSPSPSPSDGCRRESGVTAATA